MSATVEVRGVTKRYGEVAAVDNVSLSVRAGEFLTLLGPSGCGKTSLLRLIAGFETPAAGSVWLGGADVTPLPPYRRDVNQVFQSYALFPHLTVRDNIAFGLRMQRRPAAEIATRVAEAVALVALDGCEERKPHQLSGGQRQRVALARALAPRPAVLLLDEPLSALDARLRQAMQLELKRLQRQVGTTFIFVTHDQEEALTMSDRIALMHRGRVEQLAEAHELYRRPATAFAAEFMGHANLFAAELVGGTGKGRRVRLDGGLDLGVPAAAWPAGAARARVSVRPENVHLGAAAEEGDNVFEARVDEVVFKGACDRVELTAAAGTRLTAFAGGSVTVRAGERVRCRIAPEDIVVFAD